MPEILFDIAFSTFFLFIVYFGFKVWKAERDKDKKDKDRTNRFK